MNDAENTPSSSKPLTFYSRYISDVQFAERHGVHRVTIWRRAKNEVDFPKPLKLSAGCTRWRLADIEAWEAAKFGSVA